MKRLLLALLIAVPSAFGANLNLSWNDNSDNEDGFVIQRSIDGTNFVEIGTVPADQTTFVDVGVPLNETLTYRVYAENQYGDSGFSNTVAEATFQPQDPDGLKVTKPNPLVQVPRRLIQSMGSPLRRMFNPNPKES
jgi:hypothetical protein